MKNINKLTIPESSSLKPHIEYLILKGTSPDTLESLGNPDTAQQAKEYLTQVILKDRKYKDIIPVNDALLYKILFESFSENRTIENQLSIFLRQISSKIAGTRLETGFIVSKIANDTYEPVNDTYEPVNDIYYNPDKSTSLDAA